MTRSGGARPSADRLFLSRAYCGAMPKPGRSASRVRESKLHRDGASQRRANFTSPRTVCHEGSGLLGAQWARCAESDTEWSCFVRETHGRLHAPHGLTALMAIAAKAPGHGGPGIGVTPTIAPGAAQRRRSPGSTNRCVLCERPHGHARPSRNGRAIISSMGVCSAVIRMWERLCVRVPFRGVAAANAATSPSFMCSRVLQHVHLSHRPGQILGQ